jgi:tRNA threonylcarbamoyladenosine modification (KEOPS) complex  Pcc1 subunit
LTKCRKVARLVLSRATALHTAKTKDTQAMKKALHIKTTGEVIELDITADSLSTLQTAVGGWVQAIDIASDLSMWCNEEGKLISLPHNPFAQFMWDKAFGAHTDYIVGDIVLTGGTDEEGYTLGLTDEQVTILSKIVETVRNYIEPRITVTAE